MKVLVSEDITTEVQHVEPRCLETNSDYDQRWFVRAMLMIDGGKMMLLMIASSRGRFENDNRMRCTSPYCLVHGDRYLIFPVQIRLFFFIRY